MDMDADVAVIWSLLFNGRMAPNEQVFYHYRFTLSRPVIVLEIGCLHRGVTWKMGVNGLTHGCYGELENPSDRRDKLEIELKPIKEFDHKHNILICPQHNKSYSYNAHSSTPVELWVYEKIKRYMPMQRSVVVRPHPRCPIDLKNYNSLIQAPTKMFDIYNDVEFIKILDTTSIVVNFNSNPGILAAINGVPVDVSVSSLAYPVSIKTPGIIVTGKRIFVPDNIREQWLNDICYTEWTIEEIATGYPLSRLI
jgi:hypothetical protein